MKRSKDKIPENIIPVVELGNTISIEYPISNNITISPLTNNIDNTIVKIPRTRNFLGLMTICHTKYILSIKFPQVPSLSFIRLE